MKKFYTLCAAALALASANAQEFVSPGNGTTYTMEVLSKIAEAQVTNVDGAWQLNADFTISAGDVLKIQNNEVVKFNDKIQVNVEGTLDCTPADTALITGVEGTTPKGFRMYADDANAVLKNTRMEQVGITFGSKNGAIVAENCTFADYNTSNASGACLNFSASSTGKNVIDGCTFVNGGTAAIGNGANTPVGIVIKNSAFLANNTKNSNRPQINLTSYGTEDVEILDNVIIGGHFTKVGGIAVSNMMGYSYSNKVVVKGNLVKENRYGITMTGPVNIFIEDNEIIDNIYETNAMNGGSGLSLYDAAGKGKVFIKGNHIENNLWGITVIGQPNVNAGKVEDPEAEDYNPGDNVFVNNGNGGVLYDLYNNGTTTVYAQGNVWNVDEQTQEKIETVIFHKADDANLGEVIYMPAGDPKTAINDVTVGSTAKARKYVENGQIVIEAAGIKYNVAGQAIK
ncbi:hypothetical protein [Sodaliphilus sp.]|uniref:hypothetical protein n=1 Tax=Sodaliphilus sp. TaxID=2815818 RepID=UPI00388D16A6